jgi:hypothetical protein
LPGNELTGSDFVEIVRCFPWKSENESEAKSGQWKHSPFAFHTKQCYTYLCEYSEDFMIKQNITLSLPKNLIRKAKHIAFQEEKSFNELVRQCLEQRLSKTTNYAKARDRQIELLESGLDFGTEGRIKVGRDEIHERP